MKGPTSATTEPQDNHALSYAARPSIANAATLGLLRSASPTMGEIYLRDDLLPSDYDGKTPARRSIDDIYIALTEIVPIAPKSIQEQKLGFTVQYEHDSDINFIFDPGQQQKLHDKHLSARLSDTTACNRNVYILKAPLTIYKKLESHLIAEIEERNNITVKQIERFEGKDKIKRYIKITLDSCEARNDLTAKGTVNVFHATLPAKKQFPRTTQSATQGGHGGGAAAAAAPGSGNYPPITTTSTYRTPSAMHQGRALPSSSSWAGPRIQSSIQGQPSSSSNHSNAHSAPGLLPTPTGLMTLQQNHSESLIKSFMIASLVIAEKMSEGAEQPEALLANFNGILEMNGHFPILVPQEILDSAKIIYQNKALNDPNIFNPPIHHQALPHQHHLHAPIQPPPQSRPSPSIPSTTRITFTPPASIPSTSIPLISTPSTSTP